MVSKTNIKYTWSCQDESEDIQYFLREEDIPADSCVGRIDPARKLLYIDTSKNEFLTAVTKDTNSENEL